MELGRGETKAGNRGNKRTKVVLCLHYQPQESAGKYGDTTAKKKKSQNKEMATYKGLGRKKRLSLLAGSGGNDKILQQAKEELRGAVQ